MLKVQAQRYSQQGELPRLRQPQMFQIKEKLFVMMELIQTEEKHKFQKFPVNPMM